MSRIEKKFGLMPANTICYVDQTTNEGTYMNPLKTIMSILSIVLTVPLFSQKAFSADDITHFYGSAFFAMASGINQDYAVALSVGNEMIDRGIWTTPMGLPTPRLLYHFLGTPLEFTVDESGLKKGLAIATIKHPLFYNLLDVGIRAKDPVRVGAALHLLIDTFFHAGFSNLLGHGEAGHRPDMPYGEVEKAEKCFQAIIELMFLLRDMQGVSPDLSVMERIVSEVSKDEIYFEKLKKVTGGSNLKEVVDVISKRPDLFTEVILSNRLIRDTFFTDMEKTSTYRKLSISKILSIYKQQKYTNLADSDFAELSNLFKDITNRTDIDASQSLKIVIFRLLQAQDSKLSKYTSQNLLQHGFDVEETKNVLDRSYFDFSKVLGFKGKDGFNANIDILSKKNYDALIMLNANLEIFKNEITYLDPKGQLRIRESHEWSQSTHTFAERVLPQVLSWERLFNKKGYIRLVEDADVGNLISTQTDTVIVKKLLDKHPEFLNEVLNQFKQLEANTEVLEMASRLKALAEVASDVAFNSAKDIVPGKISPIKKVIYEDDNYDHAKFAKQARVEAVRNLVAEYLNINLLKGPDGFHTFLIEKVKAGLRKVGLLKVIEIANLQASFLAVAVREHLFKIGYGALNDKGERILPTERADIVQIAPNLKLSGYFSWSKWSHNYAGRLMLKMKRAKNTEIEKYIRNGEEMKDRITTYLNDVYYSGKELRKDNMIANYGTLGAENIRRSQISDLPSQVQSKTPAVAPVRIGLRCEGLF